METRRHREGAIVDAVSHEGRSALLVSGKRTVQALFLVIFILWSSFTNPDRLVTVPLVG